jgi:cell division protein FtsQ
MARRTVMDELEYVPPPEDRPSQRDRERPARRNAKKAPEGRRRRINLVYWAIPFAALVVAAAGLMAFHRVEAFLINDQRFLVRGPGDLRQNGANFQVAGLRRVTREEVLRLFENDFGRSLYLFPAAERRRNLLAIDWIRDATISRRWPNQVFVKIRERQPMAFMQFNRPGGTPYFRLVDEHGVLLPIPKGERFDLVVLTGAPAAEPEGKRAERVRTAGALLRDIGGLAARISEIDLRDPADLRVTMKLEGMPVTVQIGDHNFRPRLENFLAYFASMHEKRPDADAFDLRVDDRITAIGDLVRSEAKGGVQRVEQ